GVGRGGRPPTGGGERHRRRQPPSGRRTSRHHVCCSPPLPKLALAEPAPEPGRHRRRRRSKTATTCPSSQTISSIRISPEKRPAASKAPAERTMYQPRPELEATNSPITAPVIENGTAIRRPVKMKGSDAGRST